MFILSRSDAFIILNDCLSETSSKTGGIESAVGRKMMEMEVPEKRKGGGPKRRFLDVMKEDMGYVCAKETDVKDRTVWIKMIRCGYP